MRKSEILASGPYDSFPRLVRASRILMPADKLVYSVLLGRLGNKKWSYPGISLIADDTGLSERSVRYAIKRLAKVGLITYSLARNKQGKYKATYHYVLAIPGDVLTAKSDPQNEVILAGQRLEAASADTEITREGDGNACRTLRQRLPVPAATVAAKTNQETNQRNKAVNKIIQPLAAARVSNTTQLLLVKGVSP